MRSHSTATRLVCVAAMCLFAVVAAHAAVVTVDSAAKTAVSDTSALESKGVRVLGGVIGSLIMSNTQEPQTFTVRITGLKDQDYDVYVNSSYVGAKPAKELEQKGLDLSIPGAVADPVMMRCLTALKAKVEAECERFQKNKEPEAQRVFHTLNQAADWVRSGIRHESVYRSAAVAVVPAGSALRDVGFPTRLSATELARALPRACSLLQKARNRMYNVIEDPVTRNAAVAAMTPVDFAAVYSIRNGKPHVEASLVNNCNLPVNGDITMALPKGWKSTAKSLVFSDVKSGQTFRLSFDLVPPTKDAAPPDSIPVAANMKLAESDLSAQLKLKVDAARQ